jgi:hypothetical protein
VTRRAVAFDRIAVFVAGLCLLALGCSVIAWQQGVFGADATVEVIFADDVGSPWWPWALGSGSVVLVVLGIRWIAAHRWPPNVSRIALPAEQEGLTADATSVADAAARALESQAGLLKARGTATVDRGAPTVTLTVTVPARRGLRAGATAADRTAETVGVMLGDSVALRTVLRVDAKRRTVVS